MCKIVSKYAVLALIAVACLLYGKPLAAQSFYHKNTEYTNSLVNAEDIVIPNGSQTNTYTAVNNTLWTALNPNTSGNSIGHLKVKETRTFVKFFVDHNDPNVFAPYTYRLHFKVRGYTQPGNDNIYTELLDTLTIGYNPDSVNAYQDIHMKSYFGFYKISVQVLDVYDYTCFYTSGGNPPCNQPPSAGFIAQNNLAAMNKNWALEIGVTDQKFDRELKNGSSWVGAYGSGVQLNVSKVPPAAGNNYLKIAWNVLSGQKPSPSMYELEWIYVDDYKVDFNSNGLYFNYPLANTKTLADLGYNFKENATRIITDKEEYNIPVIYKRGYIIYRIRLLRPDENQYNYTVYSPWTVAADAGVMNTLNSNNYYQITGTDVHLQDGYNWNYNVSFAEEGKSKHVVSYFDGLLKSRQSVTKFSTLPDQQIVAESFYNYTGKPGLQTLPIPVVQSSLSFVSNFATPSAGGAGYTSSLIDGLQYAPLPAANAQSPVAGYYSPGNPIYANGGTQWKFLKALPDAEGFPFIQTRYAPEDGRVTVQGGAGKELQIGQGHETRNYYMAPEQRELDKYFGLNIGTSSFYEKTITRDPNKQLSFSLHNNKGQVVMTGLMGYPTANATLSLPDGVTVPSSSAANFPVVNLLYGNTPGWSGTTRVFNKSFFSETAGNSIFNHQLSLQGFSPCTGYYLGVPLSYTAKVFDEFGAPQTILSGSSGTVYAGTTNTPVNTAASGLTASLGIGKAIVDYKVSYNPTDVNTALDQLLYPVAPNPLPVGYVSPYPSCLKTQADFMQAALDNIRLNCDDDAEDPANGSNQCVQYDQLLQSELWPMAKYGTYREQNGRIEGTNGSIFAITGWDNNFNSYLAPPASTNDAYDIPAYTGLLTVPQPIYRYQFYLNSLSPNLSVPGTSYTASGLAGMSVREFLDAFDDNIAAFLLPLHPEYCKKQKIYCDQDDYSSKIGNLHNYAEAQSQQLGTLGALFTNDPFALAFNNSTTAADKLKKIRYKDDSGNWVETRIDIMAYAKAFCGDDPDCRNAILQLTESDINTYVSGFSADMQNQYYEELTNFYVSNRETRIAKFPVDGYTGNCTANTYAIANFTAPAVINFMYDAGSDIPNTVPSGNSVTAVLNTATAQSTTATLAADVVASPTTLDEYAAEVTKRLANCIYQGNSNPVNAQQLKAAILASMNGAAVDAEWRGGLTPDVLKAVLTAQGIKLDDLCNPYLVDYLKNPLYTANQCRSNDFYSSMGDFFNREAIWSETKDAVQAGVTNMQYGTISCDPQSNGLFERELVKKLYPNATTPQTVSFTVKYTITDKSFSVYFYTGTFRFGNSVQVYYKDNDNNFSSVQFNGWPVGSSNPTFKGYWEYDPVGNFAMTPVSFYCAAGTANDRLSFGGGYKNEGAIYEDPFAGYVKGLTIPQVQDQSSCITAKEMKEKYVQFAADVMDKTTGYAIKGVGHPFFEDAVRSYFNFYFGKNHTSKEYLDFMQGCNLSNEYKIPYYYSYLHASATDTNAMNLVYNAIRTYSSGAYKNFNHLYYFTTNGSGIAGVQMDVDFNFFPKDQLRNIMRAVSLAIATPVGNVPVVQYNQLQNEITVNSATFADLFVHYIPGAATFYPQNPAPSGSSNIAPPNMNWYPDMCGINTCTVGGGSSSEITVTSELVTVRHNGLLMPFQKFHFELANPTAVTAPDIAKLIYRYNTTGLPDVSRGFVSFNQYATHLDVINQDNSKKDYLKYAYGINTTNKDVLITQLQANALRSNINGTGNYVSNYNNYPYLSYYNPDADGLSGDLFVQKSGTTPGVSYISNVLAQVPSGPFAYNSGTSITVGSEIMQQRIIGGNTYWYNLKDNNTHAYHNIWIVMPVSVPINDYPSYQINSIEITPTSEKVKRFKLKIQKANGVELEAFGKTDFALTSPDVTVFRNVMLCDNPTPADTVTSCFEQQLLAAAQNAEENFAHYLDSVKQDWTLRFTAHIQNNISDKLEMQTPQSKYIVTLYGYDRAGNLIYTVPPEGVKEIANNNLYLSDAYRNNPLDFRPPLYPVPAGQYYNQIGNITPAHTKVSSYVYNAQNQVVSQKTPDAGTADMYYDAAGRLIFSQNAQQKLDNKYAYMMYDKQGRVIESGQVPNTYAISLRVTDLQNMQYAYSFDDLMNTLNGTAREDVVHTFYDNELTDLSTQGGMSRQENLRSRVAAAVSYKKLNPIPAPATGYSIALHYSYDLAGNVKTLTYDMPTLEDVKQRYKRIDYDFDLYSGKVTLVSYNRSFADQFYQRYEYDADNRITKVQTSRDGILWDNDASYKYYPHGPLARVNLGDLQVQGVDFAYTLQGWLKSINGDAPRPQNDMGGDGTANSAYMADLNRSSLYYFKNDYKPIDATDFTGTAGTAMLKIPDLDPAGTVTPQSLYNGNIAAAVTMPGYFPSLYTKYSYDQLNRIKKAEYLVPDYNATTAADVLRQYNAATLSGQAVQNPGQQGAATAATDLYKSEYSYDKDGNITALKRFGLLSDANGKYNYQSGKVYLMDDLGYAYENSGTQLVNNKLINFTDKSDHSNVTPVFDNDLKTYTNNTPGLYRMYYDANGNLIKDQTNNLDKIGWNLQGKVSDIAMANGDKENYTYDPLGNRFMKSFMPNGTNRRRNEYYIRDASGNILAVYRHAQQFHYDMPIANVVGPLIGKSGFGTDLGTIMEFDGSFAVELIRRAQNNAAGFANEQLDGKTAGYFMQHDNAIRQMVVGNTPGIVADVIANERGLLTNVFENRVEDDLYRPLALKRDNEEWTMNMVYLLAGEEDATTMDMLLRAFAGVPYQDRLQYGKEMMLAIYANEPGYVVDLLHRVLEEQAEGPNGRLISSEEYRNAGIPDYEYKTVNDYLQTVLWSQTDPQQLANYYDNARTDAMEILNMVTKPEDRLAVVYHADPPAFVEAMRVSANNTDNFTAALEASPDITPTGLVAKLIALKPLDIDYQQIPMSEVIDYNKFYLAEHDLYGSSRLGIRSYWPNQYVYEWDASKTAAQNTDLLNASEFNYRRPWYSKVYNSLIGSPNLAPYNNAYVQPLYSERVLGQKQYELTNHLGNVMAVVTDKITEKKQNPNSSLPTLAEKHASLFAAYDYYPFGMLMPERFIQDASQQCTPVTRTRFVKKQVPVSVIDMTSTSQYNQFTATTGITLTPVPGTGQRPGQMIVQVPDDVAGTVTLDLPGGALAAGKQISVTTQVTTDGGQPMEVQLVQVPANAVDENDLVILDKRTIRFDSDVKFDVAAVNGDNLQLLLKTTAGINMGYRVGTTQYQVVDDVQENYVVVVCNDDGEFGKDYRFGFNGQMKDNEIAGVGNFNTAQFWEYDTRLGRRWNIDPVERPWESAYATFYSNPITNADVKGDDPWGLSNLPSGFWNYVGIRQPYNQREAREWMWWLPVTYAKVMGELVILTAPWDEVAVGVFGPMLERVPARGFLTLKVGTTELRICKFLAREGDELKPMLKIEAKLSELGEAGAVEKGLSGLGDASGGSRDINVARGNQNCAGCTIAGDASLKGNPASALNHEAVKLKDFMKWFNAERMEGYSSAKGITNIMQKMDDGATGVIFGYRGPNRQGHYFNVVKENGAVKFLDFQKPIGERTLDPTTIMKDGDYKMLFFLNTTSK